MSRDYFPPPRTEPSFHPSPRYLPAISSPSPVHPFVPAYILALTHLCNTYIRISLDVYLYIYIVSCSLSRSLISRASRTTHPFSTAFSLPRPSTTKSLANFPLHLWPSSEIPPSSTCMYVYDIYLRGPPLLHPSRQVKSSSVRFYTGYFLLIRVEGCEPVFEKCVGEFLFFSFFLRMQVLLLLERSTKWGKSNLEEIRL